MAQVRIKGADGKIKFVDDALIAEDSPLFKSGSAKPGETYVDYQLRSGGSLYDDPSVKIDTFDVGNVQEGAYGAGEYTPTRTGQDVENALKQQYQQQQTQYTPTLRS